jgi:hypothetical protein
MSIYQRQTVENANYQKVSYYLDKLLSENGRFCGCPRCRMDATALALNTLPPHYFVNPSHSDSQDLGSPWILIEVAVHEAMEKVNNYPHHAVVPLESTDRSIRPYPLAAEETGAEG